MAPNHVAQEADGDHATNHYAHSAEQRLACEGWQNVRNDSEAGNDSDIDLGMPGEQEKVLPQERRASRVRQDSVADDHAGWVEEAGTCCTIENKQNARRK